MKNRFWSIRGYGGFKTIFEKRVGLGQFTEYQIESLLQALAAKAGLTFTEIVGAFAKRKTEISNNLLEIQRDFVTLSCGTNPFFTASMVDENCRIPKRRRLV